MDLKELLATLAQYDEMEAVSGMNIAEATEEDIKDLANKDEQEAADGMNLLEDDKIDIDPQVAADIERESEIAENKAKKRIYLKAIDGLQGLEEFLMDGASPSQGLDPETQEFIDKLQEIMAEIESRSLAFD